MMAFKSWLLAWRATFIALYRMSKNDYILVTNGTNSRIGFRVPKDKSAFVSYSAGGVFIFDLTIQQARQVVSLISEACRRYESRSAKIGSAKWTVDGQLHEGQADQVRLTIHDNLEYFSQPVARDGLLNAATEISRRIGFYPEENH
jgi:hypothetical protein